MIDVSRDRRALPIYQAASMHVAWCAVNEVLYLYCNLLTSFPKGQRTVYFFDRQVLIPPLYTVQRASPIVSSIQQLPTSLNVNFNPDLRVISTFQSIDHATMSERSPSAVSPPSAVFCPRKSAFPTHRRWLYYHITA